MNGDNQKIPTAGPSSPGTDVGSQALAEALRSSFGIVKIVMVILVAVFLFSGFFILGPTEKAVILRFGKPLGDEKALLGSGAHWAFPYPIDEVVRVPITEIQEIRSTVGWFAVTPEQEKAGLEPPVAPTTPLDPMVDGYALTADGNIVHLRATLNYRIEDPIRYVFSFVSASNAVQNALDNALLATTARYKVDDILTRDRIGFQDAVRQRVFQLAEAQNLGIVVDQCVVTPRHPRQLNQSFENVLNAGVNRERTLNEARSAANQLLSKTGADAAGRINTAEAERTRLIQSVSSDADTFRRLLPKYEANPDLFIQQRLVETMGRVTTNAQEKIFLAERADGKPRELRLLLNRELKQKSEPAKP